MLLQVLSSVLMFCFLSSRYLTLNSMFEEVRHRVLENLINFQSESLVRALNGDTYNGQYECTLASGEDFQVGVTYDVLRDFANCSTENGGFNLASLSSTVNEEFLYFYGGSNGPCAVSYGPVILPVNPTQPLVRDPLTVGGGVFVRLGDVECLGNGSCSTVSRTPNVCDSTLGDSAQVQRSPLPIYVTDPDGLDNSVLEFTILSGNSGDAFTVDAATGQLTLVSELDRDLSFSSFNLEMSVSDGIFFNVFNVNVTVTDVNDNDPVPARPEYRESVDEELPTPSPIVTVVFSDNDDGDNSQLTYSLDSSVTSFTIDTNGTIFTNRRFDFEAGDDVFNITVTATDGGSPPRQGTVQVIITVNDLNDNSPTVAIDGSGAQFIEDGPPVSPAFVTVNDRDSSLHPIFYAFVIVEDNLDEDSEQLSLSLLPAGFRIRSSNESVLIIVGRGSPDLYSNLLSSVLYENAAELISLPLLRTISYSVCDSVSEDTTSQLSPDTMLALNSNASADSELPQADGDLLVTACQSVGTNSTLLVLVETNDRPVIVNPLVSFPPIREDTTEENNMGSFVIDVFASATFDPDRDSRTGIAVIEYGNVADPTFARLNGQPSCRGRSNEIISNGSYECSSRLSGGGRCYCPEGNSDYSLSCSVLDSSIFFVCLNDNSFSICECYPNSPLPDVSAIVVNIGQRVDISSLATDRYVQYEFSNTQELYNFTSTTASIEITLTTSAVHILSIGYTRTFESFGVVSDSSALLLGPYTLIRWNPFQHQTGSSYFEYRAWDGTNFIGSGTRGVDTLSITDTSFSLDTGNATIVISPVNDAPEIRLGGPGEGQVNFSTTYIEGGPSVFIASPDAVVIELDSGDDFLFNLTVRISTVGGDCDLQDYGEQSDDRLAYINSTMLPVTAWRTTEGAACIYYNFIGVLTVDQWRAFITMLRFSVGNEEPSQHTREISLAISDTVSTSRSSFSFVDVTLVSDLCPVIQLSTASPILFTEHQGPIVLSGDLNVTDPDRQPTVGGAIVDIIETTNNPCGGCVLSVNVGTTGINATLSTDSLTLTLSGVASPSDYQLVLRTVTFDDVLEEPTFGLVTIRYTLQDPTVTGPCPDAVAEVSIMVEHINDNSPLLYLDYPMSQDFFSTFVEGAEAVAVTGGRVEIQDRDGQESSTYVISVSISDCNPTEDSLVFNPPLPTTLLSPYDSSTCSISFEGSSADLESELPRLRYNNNDLNDPTPSVRSIAFIITDDIHSNMSDTILTIQAVNDAPRVDLDTTRPTSDTTVTMILGTESIQITQGNQGDIVDPDTDELVSMTLSLTEVDDLGNPILPRTDQEFESLQSSDPAFILSNGLVFQYLQTSGQLRITGAASIGKCVCLTVPSCCTVHSTVH